MGRTVKMNKFSKFTKALSLSAIIGLSFAGASNAATINFNNGVAASDGSGLTSQYIDPINGGLPDYFIETFDQDTGVPGFPGSTAYTEAAPPANDTTCFGYLTNNDSGTASVEFDYTNLLDFYSNVAGNGVQLGITYLGFYWGSVDTFNDFEFYSGGSLVTTI